MCRRKSLVACNLRRLLYLVLRYFMQARRRNIICANGFRLVPIHMTRSRPHRYAKLSHRPVPDFPHFLNFLNFAWNRVYCVQFQRRRARARSDDQRTLFFGDDSGSIWGVFWVWKRIGGASPADFLGRKGPSGPQCARPSGVARKRRAIPQKLR